MRKNKSKKVEEEKILVSQTQEKSNRWLNYNDWLHLKWWYTSRLSGISFKDFKKQHEEKNKKRGE